MANGVSQGFITASQTPSRGGVIRVSSTPISYAAAGMGVVIGTSTEAVRIGGLILSMSGAKYRVGILPVLPRGENGQAKFWGSRWECWECIHEHICICDCI